MNINPFNPYYNNKLYPTNSVGRIGVQKYTTPTQNYFSFQGKKDLLQQPKEKIFQKIQASITKRNKLGEGVEASVYKIKGTEYCFRKPFFSGKFDTDFNLEMSVKDKINHVVAKLGNGCRIMNLIKGVPVATIDEKNSEKLEHIEEIIEEFPVESYNKLIKQVTYAYKNGMLFDNHWANVIVNEEDKTFTAIDFYPMDKYDSQDICTPDPLCAIFPSVMNMKASFEQMNTCTKKLLKAGLEEMKPNYQPHIEPKEFDFNHFLSWLYSYKKINMTQNDLTNLITSFEKIIELKTMELAGKTVKRNLAKEIEATNKMIDRLL